MLSAALFSRDFGELEAGMETTSHGRTVTEADVVAFAALTGDRHPQHVDAAWAACSRFGERIAHGLLVLSYAAGLLDFDPDRILALRRIADVVFKRPVVLGDTIRVTARVGALRPLDATTGLVTCEWRVSNQRSELVARATIDVLWRRGPLPPIPLVRDVSAGNGHAGRLEPFDLPPGVIPL